MYIIDAEYQLFMKCTEEIVILANVSIVSMFNIEETHASTIQSLRAWKYVGMQGKCVSNKDESSHTTVWALPPQQIVLSWSCPLESHLPPAAGRRTERKTVDQGIACDNCDFQGLFRDLPHQ